MPVQRKPILHGRDHSCGGADPIPGYCGLLELPGRLAGIIGGGDYLSVQGSRFTYHPLGVSTDHGVTTWPGITIPADVAHAHYLAGWSLYAYFNATVSRIDNIRADPVTGVVFPPAFAGTLPSTGDDRPVFVSGSGTNVIGSSPSADVLVQMIVQSSTGSVIDHEAWVENGILVLTWIGGPDSVPVPGDGLLYPGSYPIVNNDISPDANIDPLKLQRPGGTTTFLRADGAFTAASIQVEY